MVKIKGTEFCVKNLKMKRKEDKKVQFISQKVQFISQTILVLKSRHLTSLPSFDRINFSFHENPNCGREN